MAALFVTLTACGGNVGIERDPDSGPDRNAGGGGTENGASTGAGGGSGGMGGTAGTGGATTGSGGNTTGSGGVTTGSGGNATGGAGGSTGGSGGTGGRDTDAAPPPTDPDSGPNRKRIAFSRRYPNGNMGGLEGADRLCQEGALFGGVWKAWLSDSTTNAIDRIADVGPWYTMNGLLAFENKAQLAGTPSAIIEYDQWDSVVAASSYWTGTRIGGTSTKANCQNWTSAAEDLVGVWGDGRQLRGASTWTESIYPPSSCRTALNLLCIEQ